MLKVNDKVKFIGGHEHKSEMKDWAKLAGLKAGETYIVDQSDIEDVFIRIEGKKYWHHPDRFELVEQEEEKGGEDEK